MFIKTCPFCNTAIDDCACEKPFDLAQIPKPLMDGLARSMFWDIKKFFSDPQNQVRFEKWLQERETQKKGAALC